MSPPQIFHIPMSLKRSRSAAVPAPITNTKRKETKVQHILGVTEADINSARNQSVSSGGGQAYGDNSFSDGTTELGTSFQHDEKPPHIPDLTLKASSVLLHEQYRSPSRPSSIHSPQLRKYDSSSTLQSHYDAQKAPPAVSQQTSDSSRRDFALRKGQPVVVTSTTKEKDSLRQFKLLNQNGKPAADNKKLSKNRPVTGNSNSRHSTASSEQHNSSKRSSPPTSISSNNGITNKTSKGVRFMTSPASASRNRKQATQTQKSLLEPMDPACVKVNIRRPKAGAKHWFDGHEDDSSEDESVHEPEFNQRFASGLESAFQNGQFKEIPEKQSSRIASIISSDLSSSTVTPRNSTIQQPIYEQNGIVPRIAVLNAKASQSSLANDKISSSAQYKGDPFIKADLNNMSMLNLSSSDDEEEDMTVPENFVTPPIGPPLRESVALAFKDDSDVELGTAKAVNPTLTVAAAETLYARKLKVDALRTKRQPLRMPIPKRGSSLMLSYLNDQAETQNDLIASFPATPIESAASFRTSIRSSVALSEAESLESCRMMPVTKQEESLLAAMRLKKATMRYNTTQLERMEALRNLERPASRLTPQYPPRYESRSELSLDTRLIGDATQAQRRRSKSGGDTTHLRASGTTFQTNTTRNPSRLSRLSYFSERSGAMETHLSLSSSNPSNEDSASPSHLSLHTTDKRASRDTYFSTSSAGYMGHSRTVTGASSHVVALDDLDKVPNRDEIPSQEFIDWPYHGWEQRAKMGIAH